MSTIDSNTVKTLREQTGAGMMECKKALTEAGGDLEKAVEVLRKKGLAAAQKKQTRVATEGSLVTAVVGKSAVLLEVNCETDFVAKNDEFQGFIQNVATKLASSKTAVNLEDAGFQAEISQEIGNLTTKLGEKISIRRYQRADLKGSGLFGTYLHGRRIGILVEMKTDSDAVASNPAVAELAKDIAMQVAAADPKFIRDSEMDETFKNKEAEIYADQLRQQGKPEAMIGNIVKGKLAKLAQEVCLMDQKFIKDNETSVTDLVNKVSKEVGGKIEVVQFFKYNLGEGLEKKEDNLADEVAKLTSKA